MTKELTLKTISPYELSLATQMAIQAIYSGCHYTTRPGENGIIEIISLNVDDDPITLSIAKRDEHLVLSLGRYDPKLEKILTWVSEKLSEYVVFPEEVTVNKNPVLESNGWLINRFFEHGVTNLRTLKDEWLELRIEKDFRQVPSNPIQSMRTVINEEKERRKIGQ